jgi:FSR family fosmidomycin resistance protein-like MFS transporter
LIAGASLSLGAQAASYAAVVATFGLSGLGVAAFHPEAARKAYLASGDRRTTGMSLFSVGGGLGFATAPAVTTAVAVAWGTTGLLALLAPTVAIAILIVCLIGPGPAPALTGPRTEADPASRDDWRAFGILSGATVCRSIVFYGLNTFLALYFIDRWAQTAAQANLALIVFLGTSIFGTLLGGWLADRFGRRNVIRAGFAGAAVFLTLFISTSDRVLALELLVPLAIFIFMPTSVLVVLGQEYLPQRVGMASGVTLGLAVSVGGMSMPLLGRLVHWRGVETVLFVLLALLIVATGQTLLLPAPGDLDRRQTRLTPAPATVDPLG